jgi:isopentenyldiphosphate isomerase
MTKIIIVDKNDKQIGVKDHENYDSKKDIYRVSALWITNSQGQVLMAKRALTKRQHPGKWGPAVAGTIEDGETYDSNIIKEAEEELGLKNIKPKKIFKHLINGKYVHFTQWYKLALDKPLDYFIPDPEEVAEIRWFTKEELRSVDSELTDGVLESIKDLLKE